METMIFDSSFTFSLYEVIVMTSWSVAEVGMMAGVPMEVVMSILVEEVITVNPKGTAE